MPNKFLWKPKNRSDTVSVKVSYNAPAGIHILLCLPSSEILKKFASFLFVSH